MSFDSIRRPLAMALGSSILAIGLAVAPVAAHGEGGEGDAGLTISLGSTTVDPRSGIATVHGEITCLVDLSEVFISVNLRQGVGRFHSVEGYGSLTVDCLADPGSASFELDVFPYNGKFGVGSAFLEGYAESFACEPSEEEGEICTYDFDSVGPLSTRLVRG